MPAFAFDTASRRRGSRLITWEVAVGGEQSDAFFFIVVRGQDKFSAGVNVNSARRKLPCAGRAALAALAVLLHSLAAP